MRIIDILVEGELAPELRDMPVAKFGDTDVTVGDVQAVLPDVDAKTIVKYGSHINDFLQKKVAGDYTVGKALVDIGSAIPLLRRAKTLTKGAIPAAKELGKMELRRQLGHAAADQVDVMPTPAGYESSGKTASTSTKSKKEKKKVGEKIPVLVDSKKYKLPITTVLDNSYIVDASSVPGKKKGATIEVPDLLETASAGATSAGNIASIANPRKDQIVVEKPKSKKIKKPSIFDGAPIKRQ